MRELARRIDRFQDGSGGCVVAVAGHGPRVFGDVISRYAFRRTPADPGARVYSSVLYCSRRLHAPHDEHSCRHPVSKLSPRGRARSISSSLGVLLSFLPARLYTPGPRAVVVVGVGSCPIRAGSAPLAAQVDDHRGLVLLLLQVFPRPSSRSTWRWAGSRRRRRKRRSTDRWATCRSTRSSLRSCSPE